MKILLLSDDFPPLSSGGAGIVASELARKLVTKGHSVFVITTVQVPGQEERVIVDGVMIYRICARYHNRWRSWLSLYNPQTVSKIKKLISDIKPDVVHAHNVHFYLSYHALKIAKNLCGKVFLTAHDTMSFSCGKVRTETRISPLAELKEYRFRFNPFRNLIVRHYLGFVDKIICVSGALARALKNNGLADGAVIHNGIDLDIWSQDSEAEKKFRNRFNLNGKKVVFFNGRLSRDKGAFVAVEVLSKIVKKEPNAVLLVAARQSGISSQMEDLAKQKGISDKLVFTGWLERNDIKTAYFCSDAVITPSIYLDPFPTVNLEAMAAAKPVVGTCFGGTPEAITDGFNGYIVNPNDTDELAEKILDFLANPEKTKTFGLNGLMRVKQEFSLEKQVNEYLRCYFS